MPATNNAQTVPQKETKSKLIANESIEMSHISKCDIKQRQFVAPTQEKKKKNVYNFGNSSQTFASNIYIDRITYNYGNVRREINS